MSIVQWPHAVSTQRGKCVCLCNNLILPTWIRVSITLMLAQYVITKMLWRWDINIMDYEINKMSYLWLLLSLCIEVQNEKCIWKIFVKYTQIRQSNTNTNTNISSGGFSNTNTNTDICVFKYKYKYKYIFDPSPELIKHIFIVVWSISSLGPFCWRVWSDCAITWVPLHSDRPTCEIIWKKYFFHLIFTFYLNTDASVVEFFTVVVFQQKQRSSYVTVDPIYLES